MKKPTQIFPTGMHLMSDVYGSRSKAAYVVGRPDGPLSNIFALSKEEAIEIVQNLPEELKQYCSAPVEEVNEVEIAEHFEEVSPVLVEDVDLEGYEKVAEEMAVSKYQALTVKALKELAKERGLTGYSKLNEAELIELHELADLEAEINEKK